MSELLHVKHTHRRARDANGERTAVRNTVNSVLWTLCECGVSACTCLAAWRRGRGWRPVPACGWCCSWRVGGWSRSGSLPGRSSWAVPLEMWSTVSQGHAESRPCPPYTHGPHGTPSPGIKQTGLIYILIPQTSACECLYMACRLSAHNLQHTEQ